MARTEETAGVDSLNGARADESISDPHAGAAAEPLPPPAGSIIPALPSAPDPATSISPFQVAEGTTYTVDADASVYSDAAIQGGPAGFDVWGSLINFGTIWSQSAIDTGAVALSNVGSGFTNAGTVVALAPSGSVSAVDIRNNWDAGAVANSGSLYAINRAGNAYGVRDSRSAESITNDGLIAVQAFTDPAQPFDPWWPRWTGKAYGIKVEMGDGGTVVNGATGQILVEGDWAVGIWSRGSSASANVGYDIDNRGLIHAVSTSPDQLSYGLLLANTLPSQVMNVINSGTIEADVAIYAPSSGNDGEFSDIFDNAQTITNTGSGTLIGDVVLRNGDDVLNNHGTIQGMVDMGPGNDLLDTSDGSLTGLVYMGLGDDRFLGSAAADRVTGERGNDHLEGNGGDDLLMGGIGNDVLIGGSGNDGLYGEFGNDRLVTAAGDCAVGGDGNDRIELGDYGFSLADGGAGFDTLVLPGGARTIDLSAIASSGRVTNIEEIALGGSKELVVRAVDVGAISGGGNTLRIDATATDKLDLVGPWTEGARQTINGMDYRLFTSGTISLLIADGATVVVGAAVPAGATGLDPIAGGAVPPEPGDPTGLYADEGLSAIWDPINLDNRTMTVESYETWHNFDGAAVFFSDASSIYSPEPTLLVNYGQISTSGFGRTSSPVRMWLGSIENHGTLWGDNTTHGDAVGAFVGSSGTVTNSGDILASALEGDAYGVQTWDDRSATALPSVVNDATGYISAVSQLGWAIGIFTANAPILENLGTVDVSGGAGVIAVDLGNAAGGTLLNSGELYATSLSAKTVSIGVHFYDYGHLTNSGVISADVAVLAESRYGSPTRIDNSGEIYGTILETPYAGGAYGALWLNNSNLIVGDVWVDDDLLPINTRASWNGGSVVVDDLVINSGHIQGNVSLAAGNDIFDGRGGQVDGTIFGGGGNDILVGGVNADTFEGGAGSDTITGGAGNDLFIGTAAELGGDTITDFSSGDRILITDATIAGFSFNLSGTTLSFTGGALDLSAVPAGRIAAQAAAEGGVELVVLPPRVAHNDFNGDGRSDILWQDDTGQLTNWLANGDASFAANGANSYAQVSLDWHVIGTGDFDGDGAADLLWRSDSGLLTDWLGTDAGGWSTNAAATVSVPTDWSVVGVGDFNADGHADILWRQDSGQLTDWLGGADGTFIANAGFSEFVATNWKVIATGDFNGDGFADILWREDGGQLTDWLGTETGGFAQNGANFSELVDNQWQVIATGDFNGDGRDDVLWRDTDSGQMTDWLGTATGGFVQNSASFSELVALNWQVAQVGDFDGDTRDDILWRETSSGQLTNWLGTSAGGFAPNSASFSEAVATSWHVTDPLL